MSNGLMEKFQDIVETGEIPQNVSNGLLMAGVLDNSKRLTTLEETTASKEEYENLEARVQKQEGSSRRWNGMAVFFAALITGVGAWLRGE